MPAPSMHPTDKPSARHTRLYVACQLAGWGLWTLVYIGLVFAQGDVLVKGGGD